MEQWPVGGLSIHTNPPAAAPLSIRPDLTELRALIEEFKKAVAAAKVVDTLTAQPDCEDPKKAALVDRVAELERRLAALESVVGTP